MFPKSLAIPGLALLIVFAGCTPDTSATSPAANPSGSPAPELAAAPQTAAQIKWLTYTDSAEGAFSMDVPYGWQVQGGMYRFGYFDVRWMMDIRSLDGKVILRINDADVPPYALPGPSTGRPGQPYFKPQQFQMMVDNYRDAQPY